MEEAEQSLEPKEDRLKDVTGPPDGAVVKVSTEVWNGNGNMMEEVRHYGDENNVSEELKAAAEVKCLGDVKNGEDEKNLHELKVGEEMNGVKQIKKGEEDENIRETNIVVENEARCLGDVKNGEDEKNLNELKVREEMNGVKQIKKGEEDENIRETNIVVENEARCLGDVKNGEDEKNLNELKVREEMNGVKQIKNGEEDKNIRETNIVVENEARKDAVGDEKVAGDSQDLQEKKDFEISIGEEKKMEVHVQNGTEMKFIVERVEDEAVEEDVKYSNEKYVHGDVEAIGGKSKEEGSSVVDDISVKELENGEDEGGVEGMKVDENGKPTSSERVEDSVLIQVEEDDREKVRKDARDMEMVEAKDVVEEEALQAKDEERLAVREREEDEKDNGENAGKIVSDNEKVESLKRKRSRDRRTSETDEAKKDGDTEENVEELEVNGSRKRSKEVLSSPVGSSNERPVRERKTVERLVEVIEKGPDSTVIIEKGRGTPLREIPNVAYKLARKKPVELKFLHQTLFGRKGKAADFKSNLLRFSGFAWHESEEKQRAKIKEKLDKSVKENLLELCDLFDLSVSKTNARKDEIIMKVLDFLEAPQKMSDVMHAEKQLSKSRKRSKSSGNNFGRRSRQRHEKTEDTRSSDVKSSHNGNDDEENEVTEEDNNEDKDSEKAPKEDEESDAEEKESEEPGGERGDETKFDGDFKKEKQLKKSPKWKEKQDVKNSLPKQASSDSVKRKIGSDSKISSTKIDGKNSLKTPPSKNPKSKKIGDTGENALSKKKDAESPNKSDSKSNSKEKPSASKGRAKSGRAQKSGPTKAELRNSICRILKEVDFNTATFTDILNQLASEYKIDLTPRKFAIKLMIQEELTKLGDEEEEYQEED
ncbi:DNA ligase 1-like isoform X2 [Phalaenopsis equestris]|uniref:DNA ligase 1-like isoform X2 n=1 Tax=Phalaenopsis equestris TaxID=78828 RepID=UPI0009E58933|nr:DNA ligase 1-like isoform X2 [Phalaenopsis equestris]